MKTQSTLWALAWAAAIIVSAFVFHGSATGLWVESMLTGLGLTFVVLRYPRPTCLR